MLIVADSYGPLHDALGRELSDAAVASGLAMRHAVVSNFGSDASSVLRAGNVGRSACLAFATENTHGFEIAHLDGISNCVRVLERWLRNRSADPRRMGVLGGVAQLVRAAES